MTSSVSVVSACERQVSHTSSPILTSFSDISSAHRPPAAARRSARWGFVAEDPVTARLDSGRSLCVPLLVWVQSLTAAPLALGLRAVCFAGVCGSGTRCPGLLDSGVGSRLFCGRASGVCPNGVHVSWTCKMMTRVRLRDTKLVFLPRFASVVPQVSRRICAST
jgi:hypothetical protein